MAATVNNRLLILMVWFVLLLLCYVNFEVPGQIGAPLKILFSEGVEGLIKAMRTSPQTADTAGVVAVFQASIFTTFIWNIRRIRSQPHSDSSDK